MNRKHLFSIVILSLLSCSIFASSFFSGFTGGKLNYSGEMKDEKYTPDLTLQAFFQGQLNFSENIWSHIEFSLDTKNLLSSDFFDQKTDSKFKIDELSFIFKGQMDKSANYFSVFMGTYDPVGSDIYLQRYLGAQPFASKITESWLGLGGSILYPHNGIGISDVLCFEKPRALGTYLYFNRDEEEYFDFNLDLRYAFTYRYFTMDIATGFGFPINTENNKTEALLSIPKVCLHGGTTILVGNNYTQSLFIQGGIYGISLDKKAAQDKNIQFSHEKCYLLIEPRFKIQKARLNISIFSLPPNTVDKLLFVYNTLGINANIFADSVTWGSNRFTMGAHASLSFPDKYFTDLFAYFGNINAETTKEFFNNFDINITPYLSTNLLSGEAHGQVNISIMDCVRNDWSKAISVDLGYRVQF